MNVPQSIVYMASMMSVNADSMLDYGKFLLTVSTVSQWLLS
jgi:hypothetical protein